MIEYLISDRDAVVLLVERGELAIKCSCKRKVEGASLRVVCRIWKVGVELALNSGVVLVAV